MTTEFITSTFKCIEGKESKIFTSESYNFVFSKVDGRFWRWGKTKDEDPMFSPFGPELLDIEISINGCPNAGRTDGCKYCYKGNTNGPASNMTLEQFKKIINGISPTVLQIALGITGVQTNPDFIPIMQYCRSKGIIPNFTLSGVDLTPDLAKQTASIVGALAVSVYDGQKDVCYDTVKTYTDLGVNQTNIHCVVCEENKDFVMEVLDDVLNDPRLEKLHAIVFLMLKPKGRAKDHFTPLSYEGHKQLVEFCMSKDIVFGFDSCSSPLFEKSVLESDLSLDKKKSLIGMSESCESGLFSLYINWEAIAFPCSFTENEAGWEEGIPVGEGDFIQDVWYHPRLVEWRENLLSNHTDERGCRNCPTFSEVGELSCVR